MAASTSTMNVRATLNRITECISVDTKASVCMELEKYTPVRRQTCDSVIPIAKSCNEFIFFKQKKTYILSVFFSF